MDTFPKIAESVVLEHQIAQLMAEQKIIGWPFDVRKAQELENQLLTELENSRRKLRKSATTFHTTCLLQREITRNKATLLEQKCKG